MSSGTPSWASLRHARTRGSAPLAPVPHTLSGQRLSKFMNKSKRVWTHCGSKEEHKGLARGREGGTERGQRPQDGTLPLKTADGAALVRLCGADLGNKPAKPEGNVSLTLFAPRREHRTKRNRDGSVRSASQTAGARGALEGQGERGRSPGQQWRTEGCCKHCQCR